MADDSDGAGGADGADDLDRADDSDRADDAVDSDRTDGARDLDRADGADVEGVSPWLRDDWSAAPAPLDRWETPDRHRSVPDSAASRVGAGVGSPVASSETANESEHDHDRGRRVWAVLGVGAVLTVLGIGIWVAGDDGSATDDDLTAPADTTTNESTAPASTSAPAPTATTDASPQTTVPPTTVPPMSIADSVLIGDGDAIEWTEATQDPGPVFADMTEPTEVVIMTDDRKLQRIEFPSGRVRTFDLTMLASEMDLVGAAPQVTVGPTALVVTRGSDLTVFRADDTVAMASASGGADTVQSRTGTDDFVVTGAMVPDGAVDRRWILRPEGTLVDAPSPIADTDFWETSFLPSGALVLNRPGGAYAIADDGTATRISTGALIATGVNHYLVQECDETLQCRYVTVDGSTGETTEWNLEGTDPVLNGGIGTSLSPDGQAVIYFDYSDDHGRRRMLDLATGESFDVGPIDQLVWDQNWAVDSSGVFIEANGDLAFLARASGLSAVFNLDARVVSAATRRPPAP